MNRITQITEATQDERNGFLNHIGWQNNPFARDATLDEYVIPSEGSLADIASHLQNYTGPILIHSRYSGIGKTTLLELLLQSFSEGHMGIHLQEHNVTPYELVAIVADELGIGKSSSTKLTEQKIRNALDENDRRVMLGVDEFGLNDPDTLHVIQFLNDIGVKVVLTGMTSQWDALGVGDYDSDERAFRRRVSYRLELEPLTVEQGRELYQRRVASVTEYDHDDYASVPLGPFTEDTIEAVHEEAHGVPGVMVAAFNELIGYGAYLYRERGIDTIDPSIARDHVTYPDPKADVGPAED